MDMTMDNPQAKSFMEGWLVGFIEGEGSFSLVRSVQNMPGPGHHKYHGLVASFSVGSTDFELAEKATRIMQDLGLPVYKTYRRHTMKKDQLCIHIRGLKRMKRVLDWFAPRMTPGRKKDVAETILSYVNRRLSLPHQSPYTKEDFEFYIRMRTLNGYDLKKSLRDSTRGVFDYKTKVESNPTGNGVGRKEEYDFQSVCP